MNTINRAATAASQMSKTSEPDFSSLSPGTYLDEILVDALDAVANALTDTQTSVIVEKYVLEAVSKALTHVGHHLLKTKPYLKINPNVCDMK